MTSLSVGFYQTTIGKKVVMAVSGVIFVGFVFVHMIGNLQIFAGPEQLNNYAAFLKSLGNFLWVFRAVLLTAAILHIVTATQLTLRNMAARPNRYQKKAHRDSTYASRTMVWGGPILGLFIVYHLLHLTVGSASPSGVPFDPANVYNNVVLGFQVGWVSAIYIVANLLLGLHLFHGASSMFQTIGANHPSWNHWPRRIAILAAFVVTIGNISIPASVLAGYIQPVL